MRFQKRLRECSSGVRKARPAWQALVWPFWYDPFWNGPFVWSPGTFSSLTGQKSRVELHSPDFVILPSKSGLRTYYLTRESAKLGLRISSAQDLRR